jgi:hypothetical protein
MRPLVEKLGKKTYRKVWNRADDAIASLRMLSEIYDNVPPELDCNVAVLEIHVLPEEKREAVMQWLNAEDEDFRCVEEWYCGDAKNEKIQEIADEHGIDLVNHTSPVTTTKTPPPKKQPR